MLLSALACTDAGPGDTGQPDCEAPGVLCTVVGVGQNGFNGEDLPADESWLYYPSALALHPDGRLVIDDFNNMLIRALEPDRTLSSLAGNNVHAYAVEGPALDSPMENPVDVAVDGDGGLYVAELHAARILYVDPSGELSFFAGSGEPGYAGDGGPATEAQLSESAGVALAPDGRVFVSDTDNGSLRVVEDGVIETFATGLADPQRLRVAGEHVYVADTGNDRVVRYPLAGGEVEVLVEGLSSPYGLAVDGEALWIADSAAHVVRRWEDGELEVVVGEEGVSGFDEVPAALDEAHLAWPADVLVEDDAIWIADMQNGAVRRFRREG